MMTLANYGIKSGRHKDPNSAKSLNKSLQTRNRAELALKQCLKSYYRLPDEKRADIIALIEEYYSRVPFDMVIWNKYQIKQSIVDSILLLDSAFNPYKARRAFKAVEEMLLNLIHLPWHKEFTKISTYSGGFRHNISEPLVGIEEVFKAAGFEPAPCNSHTNLILANNKMPQVDESESVLSVLFDCMVAQVVLSDVITLFESCCKSSLKQIPAGVANDDINCYNWIQAYLRERSHQLTDKARSNIQDLLNNISNHMTKLRLSNSKSDRELSASRRDHIIDHTLESNSKSSYPLDRKFSSKKSLDENNLLGISEDLLKLPDDCGQVVVDRSYGQQQRKQYPSNNDNMDMIDFVSQPSGSHSSIAPPQQASSWRDSHSQRQQQQHQTSATTTRPGLKPIGSDPYDATDGSKPIMTRDFTNHKATRHDLSINSQPLRTDIAHNDREPLLPSSRGQERRLVGPVQHSNETLLQRGSPLVGSQMYHRSQLGHYSDNHIHNPISGRFQYVDEPLVFGGVGGVGGVGGGSGGSGSQASSQQTQGMIKNSSSRYDNNLNNNNGNRKYESRDMEKTTFNRRLHWSCGSCTFNNHLISEICEMCGNRRPA